MEVSIKKPGRYDLTGFNHYEKSSIYFFFLFAFAFAVAISPALFITFEK